MEQNKTTGMTYVESSCLLAVSENKEDYTLDVKFHSGTTYRYFDVPGNLLSELLAAESHGKFFSQNIRTQPYIYKKLNDKGEVKISEDDEDAVNDLMDEIKNNLSCLVEIQEDYSELEEESGDSSTQDWGIDDEISYAEEMIDYYSKSLAESIEELDKFKVVPSIYELPSYIKLAKNINEDDFMVLEEAL